MEDIFEDVDLLAQISAKDREELDRNSIRKSFAKGTIITAPGQHIRHVYYILSGRVKIYDLSASGREIIFRICGPKSFFGIAEIFTEDERLVFAEALDDSEVTLIDQKALEWLVQQDPRAALFVIRILGSRIRQNHRAIKGFVFGDARSRVARLLVKLAEIDGRPNPDGSVTLGSRFTHQVIADMTGATRQTVTEIMNEFKRQAYIESSHGAVTLKDPSRLKGLDEG